MMFLSRSVHRWVPVAAVFCALVWATGRPAAAQERPQGDRATQVLSLSASAFEEVAQDWLVMHLSITREGTDASQVQAQIRSALDSALELANARARAQAMEVRTGHFGLHPRYGTNGRINGWQGRAELVLEGRDFALIARTAGSLPQLTVSASSFALSRQARQALEAQVQRAAIERFRSRADDIARAFGFSSYMLGEVAVSSADGGGGQPRPVMMMAQAARAMESDVAVPVEAGKEMVQITVSGSIHLR